MLGDGVWEGLAGASGRIALEMHLGRLFEAAKAIDLDIGMSGPPWRPRCTGRSRPTT